MRFASILLAVTLASAQDKPTKSLYERVGRYDAIAAITDEYLKGIRADPQFTRFTGRSADSLKHARQLLKDQLCSLTGGPCVYIGREMEKTHSGLAITDAEWAANMKYMSVALDKTNITGRDKEEFLALVESLKKQITARQ